MEEDACYFGYLDDPIRSYRHPLLLGQPFPQFPERHVFHFFHAITKQIERAWQSFIAEFIQMAGQLPLALSKYA